MVWDEAARTAAPPTSRERNFPQMQPKNSPNTECGSNATVISESELEQRVLEAIQNFVILHPKPTGGDVVAELFGLDEGYLLTEFSAALLRRFVAGAVRAERRKSRPKPVQILLFDDLPNLPRRISNAEGKRPLLAKSTITDVRWHVKSLNQKHRDRIADLQELLDRMEKYVGPKRRLTVLAVAQMEAPASE